MSRRRVPKPPARMQSPPEAAIAPKPLIPFFLPVRSIAASRYSPRWSLPGRAAVPLAGGSRIDAILSPPALTLRANDRDKGEPHGSAPPTPPYVRVRIRRFEKLR